MKRVLLSAAAGLLFVGCTSTENNSVSQMRDGTPVYDLNDQPQTSVAGEGSLMTGAYDSRQIPTGQFTGQERTAEVIGQQPTLPREADARELDRSRRTAFGTGAGTLGQTGLLPEGPIITGSSLLEEPTGAGGGSFVESSSVTNNPTIPNSVDVEKR